MKDAFVHVSYRVVWTEKLLYGEVLWYNFRDTFSPFLQVFQCLKICFGPVNLLKYLLSYSLSYLHSLLTWILLDSKGNHLLFRHSCVMCHSWDSDASSYRQYSCTENWCFFSLASIYCLMLFCLFNLLLFKLLTLFVSGSPFCNMEFGMGKERWKCDSFVAGSIICYLLSAISLWGQLCALCREAYCNLSKCKTFAQLGLSVLNLHPCLF